ncbi:hypothetical protein RFI_03510, partial [Reticulomyxa filosa]
SYLTSIIGIGLIPFALALLLLVSYCVCCVPWCTCEKWTKKCCCRLVWDSNKGSKIRKYTPLLTLGIALCFIVWGGSEGNYGNTQLHNDIFGKKDGSFQTITVDMFDTFIQKFKGIEPVSTFILLSFFCHYDVFYKDNLELIVNAVNKVVKKNGISNATNNIIHVMGNLTEKYGHDIVFSATIKYAYDTTQSVQYNITCTYCNDVGSSIRSLNSTLTPLTLKSLNYLSNALNGTKLLSEAHTLIDEQVSSYYHSMNSLLHSIRNASTATDHMLDQIDEYDVQRQTAGSFGYSKCFVHIFIYLYVRINMYACANVQVNPRQAITDKYSFARINRNWCSGMCLGTVMMLFLSLFTLIIVGWADFCVRLDDFEVHLGNSQLGQLLLTLTGGGNVTIKYNGNNDYYSQNVSTFGIVQDPAIRPVLKRDSTHKKKKKLKKWMNEQKKKKKKRINT